MNAHTTLWVDDKGQLCEAAPSRGLKIAATKGDEIPQELVEKYGLSEEGGKVVQKQQAKAENKAVEGPPNKGGSGLSIVREPSGDKPEEPKDSSPSVEEAPADPVTEPEPPKAKKKKRSR